MWHSDQTRDFLLIKKTITAAGDEQNNLYSQSYIIVDFFGFDILV